MGCSYIAIAPPPVPPPPLVYVDEAPSLPALPLLDPLPPLNSLPDLPAVSPADPAAPAETFDSAGDVSVEWVESQAPGVVSDVMEQTGILARESQASALATIEALADYGAGFEPLTPPAVVGLTVDLPPLGDAPPEPDLTPGFVSAPVEPAQGAVPDLELPAPPVYDISDIDIGEIELPDPFDALLAAEPELDPLAAPVEPSLVLPAAPTLLELALPEMPTVDTPLFDATIGAAPSAPDTAFTYSEVAYSTTLLTAMQSRVFSLVADDEATAIEAMEPALWERAADREALLTHRATGEALRLLRSRGFSMPEATLVRVVQQSLQHGLNRDSSLQRDIAIERAALQQKNLRFAIETAITLESRMIDKANAAQARALEAAKATVTAEIQIFNARVLLFMADVQVFAVRAEAFKTRLIAALARIETYKAQLEALRVVGDINSQRVAIYSAQVDAVRAVVGVFKTRVDAARMLVAQNTAAIENFRARIAALEAKVAAKGIEYDTFAARVKGQAIRAGVFGKQVEVYRTRVGAFGDLAKAKIGVQDLQFKQRNEFPLELYRTRLDAYKAGSNAAIDQLKAVVATFVARTRAFVASEGAKYEHVGAEAKVAAANAQTAIARAEVAIDTGKANLTVAESYARIAQDNLRSAGQLSGQLSAAAVAAQSVHASIAESGSFAVSNSAGVSASNSNSTSSTTSQGSSSSTNVSNSSTTGVSVGNTSTNSRGRSYNRGYSNTTSTRVATQNETREAAQNLLTTEQRWVDEFTVSQECTEVTTHTED